MPDRDPTVDPRSHLLLGESQLLPGVRVPPAQRPTADEVTWDDRAAGGLVLRPQALDPPLTEASWRPADRRGAARERFGSWLMIGPDRRHVLLLPPRSRAPQRYWPVERPAAARPDTAAGGPFTPAEDPLPALPELRGLAITDDQHLVVGLVDPLGLLVADLYAGGDPWFVALPGGGALVDLAADPAGGVWTLRATDGGARVDHLDRELRTAAPGPAPSATEAGFSAATPAPTATPAEPPAPPASTAVELTLDDVVAIAASGPGRAVVATAGGRLVAVTRRSTASLPVLPVRITPVHDLAVTVDGVEELLHVVAAGSRLAHTYRLRDGELVPEPSRYQPLHGFDGGGLHVAGGVLHASTSGRVTEVVDQARRRFATAGRYTTGVEALDSGASACVWHRLVLDGRMPPGTRIVVASRAADDPADLAATPWADEPALVRRQGAGGEGGLELLLQHAVGRHLQLRLDLRGDGLRTPRIHAVEVTFPRPSWVQAHLPAVYREDPTSASFLERYLANVEGVVADLEGRLGRAHHLIDPSTTPTAALDWLAAWVGMVLEPGWDDERRRLALRYAVSFAAERGTRAGLLRALRLAGDRCIDEALFTEPQRERPFGVRLVEAFRVRGTAPAAWVTLDRAELAAAAAQQPTGVGWSPAQGRAVLEQRFAGFLAARDRLHAWSEDPAVRSVAFPALQPPDPRYVEDWLAFVREELGGLYGPVTTADRGVWQRFIAGRYRRVEVRNALQARSGGTAVADFTEIPLPERLPADVEALTEWWVFATRVLPVHRAAHRFTVYVPVELDEPPAEREARLSRVRRVAEVHRPAHTAVDVRPYWAACRVGAARLGHETVVGDRSRFAPLALDRDRLAGAFLPGRHPWPRADRFVADRDPLGASTAGPLDPDRRATAAPADEEHP